MHVLEFPTAPSHCRNSLSRNRYDHINVPDGRAGGATSHRATTMAAGWTGTAGADASPSSFPEAPSDAVLPVDENDRRATAIRTPPQQLGGTEAYHNLEDLHHVRQQRPPKATALTTGSTMT